MKEQIVKGLQDSRAILEALPAGLVIYDEDRRLVLANAAYCATLGFAPGTFRPLSTMAENARLVAYRGLFGPGDPEAQAAEMAAMDVTQERRVRRRHPDGRTYEAHTMPLPHGAHMVCVTDTTSLIEMRDEAELAVTRIHAALAALRTGLAVFSPDRTMALHNRRFTELLGLPSPSLPPGMPFNDVLQNLKSREEYAGLEGDMFLAGQMGLDRARPAQFRRTRTNGQVIDVQSDPLPDGGWTLTVADITPLARAEDEARRRANLLDSILRQVPHGISVYGPDRRLTMVNEAYTRIMASAPIAPGDTLAEVIRRRARAGEFGPGDPDDIFRKQMAHDISVPQSRRRRRPDGSSIEVRTAPLPDGGHISVVTDVSALVDAQAELALKAELMASIVSHIPHGVSVYGPDRRLRLVNTAYNEVMRGAPVQIGESVDEVIEKRARAGEFGPGDPAAVAEQQRAHDNTRPQMRRRRRPGGNTIDIRTAPLPDGGHISVVTDVTQLVAAEAEAAARAATMDAMLANIRHGIVLWDQDRRIIAANAVIPGLLGVPAELMRPGRRLEEVVQAELERGNLGDGPTAKTRAHWLLNLDRSRPHEDQRLTRDGRVIEVRSDPTPHGGFVTTYTDVSQMREAEDALRLSKSAAEAANAAKSRFLAAMSTELRSPLSIILSETAAIAQEASDQLGRFGNRTGTTASAMDAGRIQAACQTVSGSARQLLTLIDTILDVARLEAGRFELSDDTVDIPHLVRACLRQSDSAAAAAEVALVVDLPENLPLIRGDERRLRQALAHVLSNAVKFTGATGSVSIGARHDWSSGELLLQVRDTGIGIAEADLDRIFEPFTQIHNQVDPETGDRVQGAGLGLYVSRILLRAHGGELVLRSAHGQGTTATLHIPAHRVVARRRWRRHLTGARQTCTATWPRIRPPNVS